MMKNNNPSMEYNTESESELLPTVDSDQDDDMTFLPAVTTRSGRTVRIRGTRLYSDFYSKKHQVFFN